MSASDPEHDGSPDAEHPSSPEPDPLDVDSAFAAIIAGWADAPTTGNWPAEEDLAVGRHRRVDDGNDLPGAPKGPANRGTDPDQNRDDDPDVDSLTLAAGPLMPFSLSPPQLREPDDEAGAFVPPEPPPLPRGDLISRLAWAGVLGGPVFLLIVVLGFRNAPQALIVAALGGFVAGFITLVARMPKHRDDDDDGAVV